MKEMMEPRKVVEKGEREGVGKVGRPSRKELLERGRSWSVSSEKSIEEYMKREGGRRREGRGRRDI